MKKNSSLSTKILLMISLTSVITCILVTATGAAMIYMTTENGVRTELETAAYDLYNYYDMIYPGEYYMMDGSFRKGSVKLTGEKFSESISRIHCGDDVDFTLFWGSERLLTSVENKDGSFAVGTNAPQKVTDEVLSKGIEYYNRHININGRNYFGYYIPIKHASGETVGMVFAGKPSIQAEKNMRTTISILVVISLSVLIISVLICIRFSDKLITALIDVKGFMEEVAGCRFEVKLSDRTLKRADEVGDIARSAQTLMRSLRDLIERDPLTSMLNRRSCRLMMEEIIENKKLYSVAMGDIDFFKKVNDTFGHACGDMVLKELSAILNEEAVKINASVSRWGGEEFLIVFPMTNLIDMYAVLEKIVVRVRATEFMWEGARVPVTMTIGAVEAIRGESLDDTVNRADYLLYEGKRTGRNKIVLDSKG